MIKVPENYRDLGNDYVALTPGGHKCVIMQAVETKSQNGKQMLVISFDTADEDPQPKYFSNRYLKDTRPDRKWSGNAYIVLEGEYADQNLSRFCTAVEDSNNGFKSRADGGYLKIDELKKKKVGIVFRQEEYTKTDNTLGVSVKPVRFCSYDKAFEQKVPERKALPVSQEALRATTPASLQQQYEWVNVPADALEDEGLPFN